MRIATTLILLVLALALGLFAFLDHTGVTRKLFGSTEPPTLSAPVAKAITGFTFTNGDNRRSLQRINQGWRLTAPVEDAANPEWVQKALEVFSSLRVTEYLPDRDGALRPSHGLNPTVATTLEIDLSDGKKLTYQIGRQGPFENSAYVFPGTPDDYEGTFVVAGDFSGLAAQPVADIVDPVLARFDQTKAISLAFQKEAESTIELRRNEDPGSRWRLESPMQQQADDDIANELLTSLATLPVHEVHFEDPSPSESVSTPPKIIRIGTARSEELIELSYTDHPSNADLLQARHSQRPLLYDIRKDVLGSLFPSSADSLRETKLLRLSPADLSSAVITPQNGAPLKLEHTAVWLLSEGEGPGSLLANPDQGERFLDLFNKTEVVQYLQGGQDKRALYGLENPRFTVALSGENLGPLQSDTLVMRVGMPLGGSPHVFVAFENTNFIAAVPPAFLTGLAQASSRLKWKKLEVLNVAFDQIQDITITSPGKDTLALKADLLNQKIDQRLLLDVKGQDRTADMDKHAAGQLLLDVGNLNADSWVTVTQESTLALTDPSLTIQVSRRADATDPNEEASAEWTLRFAPVNAKVPLFYYGQLEGTDRPEPFLIKRELYQRLSGAGLLLDSP